jgi:hypothetical protein
VVWVLIVRSRLRRVRPRMLEARARHARTERFHLLMRYSEDGAVATIDYTWNIQTMTTKV